MGSVLVTGASGLLGSRLAVTAANEHDVVGTFYQNDVPIDGVRMRQVDLTGREAATALGDYDPDIVVHCAALADVDRCEREPTVAHELNVSMAEHVAQMAAAQDARLLHVSTDAIFDGRDGEYTEDDPTNPINIYGETKRLAEKRVQALHDDVVVVRTNFYGWNRTDASSLAEWMLATLRRDEELTGLTDAYFTPLYTGDLADYLLELADRSFTGVLHVAGGERLSKLEFAYELADVFGFGDDLITPITQSDLDFDAPRGTDLSLDVSRAESVLGEVLPNARSGLRRMKEECPDE